MGSKGLFYKGKQHKGQVPSQERLESPRSFSEEGLEKIEQKWVLAHIKSCSKLNGSRCGCSISFYKFESQLFLMKEMKEISDLRDGGLKRI